jgi:uncharacterized protein (TIGR02453 family)
MERHFKGFAPAALEFLESLASEQNRDWFQARKADYQAGLQGPMIDLILDLSSEMARRGLPLQADPKRSVFRIHRDTRFSKDKRPYKTHIGATLARGGEKLGFGLVYVHIDPKGSFAACGFYKPESPQLQAIRRAIAALPDRWHAVEAELAGAGVKIEPDSDALKRVPRGFEDAAPEVQDMLRNRSFITRIALSRKEVASPALVDQIAGFAETVAPLLRFGWATGDGAQ